MFKLKPYLEMVGLTDDEKTKELANPRSEQARLELLLNIQKLREEQAQAQLTLREALCAHPLKISSLLSAQKDITVNNWKISTLQTMLGQLFPGEADPSAKGTP
jgi:hypothetical protein